MARCGCSAVLYLIEGDADCARVIVCDMSGPDMCAIG